MVSWKAGPRESLWEGQADLEVLTERQMVRPRATS